MSEIRNSQLIDDLYSEEDPERAIEIGDEMKDIGDPVFIFPLFAAYKRFKSTSIPHYFLTYIEGIKKPEAVAFLKKIATSDLDDDNVDYLLSFYEANQFFDSSFLDRVRLSFFKDLNKDIRDYKLSRYLSYFQAAGIFSEFEDIVLSIFEGDEYKKDSRSAALGALFRHENPKYFKYYLENYNRIKDSRAEIIFAKELSGWKNGLVEDLKKLVIKEGSQAAKEIIEAKNKQDKKTMDEKEKIVSIKFNNAQITTEISSYRRRINTFTKGDTRFGFSIFNPSEVISEQTEGAEDKQKLVGYSIELRSFIQDLNIQDLSKHNVGLEEAKKKIPGLDNLNGSINQLNLFLLSKNIGVDDDLMGLRSLNKVVSRFAHPDSEAQLIMDLKEIKLYDLYKNEDWQNLHRKLLEIYRDFLSKLLEKLQP